MKKLLLVDIEPEDWVLVDKDGYTEITPERLLEIYHKAAEKHTIGQERPYVGAWEITAADIQKALEETRP
jgi:regulator of RNase E activity RraA